MPSAFAMPAAVREGASRDAGDEMEGRCWRRAQRPQRDVGKQLSRWFKGKDAAAKATTANSMQRDREGRARHRAGMQ